MKRLRKFISLTNSDCAKRSGRADRHLLLSAVLILGAIRLGMWFLSFETLRQLLARLTQANSQEQTLDRLSIEKIVWAVNVASSYTPGQVMCLARALTTQVLLNRYGYSPELRIGVAKGDKERFEAHAWVEYQGQVVIGHLSDLGRFTPLPSFKWSRGEKC